MTTPVQKPMSEVTLYSLTLAPVAKQFNQVCLEKEVIPGNVLIDIYLTVAGDEEGDIRTLEDELSHLSLFSKLMHPISGRSRFHRLFKEVNNRVLKHAVSDVLQNQDESPRSYKHIMLQLLPTRLASNFTSHVGSGDISRNSLLQLGMQLGEFLYDAGWFSEGAQVLHECFFLCLEENDLPGYTRSISFIEKLLVAQVGYSSHEEAQRTFESAKVIIEKLKDAKISMNFAGVYSAFSSLSYLECNYNDALEWSVKALEELKSCMYFIEPELTVDILRQSAKSCVVKREFHKAELLIKEAVYLARDLYGSKSVKYADALLDYGYYLLNRDSVQQAVAVYRECHQIRSAAYDRFNLKTAIVLEDLSYALYVKEYSTGKFDEARNLSQSAISTLDVLLQSKHLQLASAKRVKALILEEIAIDSHGAPLESDLLKEAEQLHLEALKLSKQVFGEMNVQIAKHYGNLGRLYQTMRKYPDAEAMHLKAISIKEKLLGLFDYEVALSVGHLASLYNYDMEQYRKAEELHLRSISIGKRLFGDAYSGLEYDYRGLLQIYNLEGNHAKFEEYSRIFTQWKMLRDLKVANMSDRAISESQISQPVSKVINDFFSMQWVNAEN